MKKGGIFLLLLIGVMHSCKHQAIVYPNPEVNITLPVSGGIYHNGDTVKMKMNILDEEALKDAFIYVRSDVDSFFTYAPFVNELGSFNVDTFWVVSGMTGAVSAFVTVVAQNSNEGVSTLNVPLILVP